MLMRCRVTRGISCMSLRVRMRLPLSICVVYEVSRSIYDTQSRAFQVFPAANSLKSFQCLSEKQIFTSVSAWLSLVVVWLRDQNVPDGSEIVEHVLFVKKMQFE